MASSEGAHGPSSDLVEETSPTMRDRLAFVTVVTFALVTLAMGGGVVWAAITDKDASALLGAMALGLAALKGVWGLGSNGR